MRRGDATGTTKVLLGAPEELSTGSIEITGEDFAGGSSVVMADGVAHVAYYVYRQDRGQDLGLYHARVSMEGIETERVGDFRPHGDPDAPATGKTRDAQGRTAMAYDNGAYILYGPCPQDLMYARERDGYEPVKVIDGIMDQSRFWSIEVDGSFGFDIAPDGTPAFVFDRWSARDVLPERGFQFLGQEPEEAPLAPVHGNPNLAMRLAFDDDGNAQVGAGFGGTDTYAVRYADGFWARQDLPRFDVWELAVDGDGTAVFAYTQPHGGTTLATSWFAPQVRPSTQEQEEPAGGRLAPRIGP